MRIIIGAFALLVGVAACKQSEQAPAEPKGRYEPRNSITAPAKPAEKNAGALPTVQRSTATLELETRLNEFSKKYADMRTKSAALASPDRETVSGELDALTTKLEAVRTDFAAAKMVDDAAWSARKEQLERDIAAVERDMELVKKKLG